MRKFLLVFVLAFIGACSDEKLQTGELTDYLPQNSALILQFQNPDLFFSNLQNNELLKENREHPLFKKIQEKVSVLEYFPHKNEALLALVAGKQEGTIDFTFISRGRLAPHSIDSISNVQVETFTTEEFEITKYILEGKTAFSSFADSITILSSSRQLLEESLKGSYIPSQDLLTSFKAASEKRPSVFINHALASPLVKDILPDVFSNHSNWTVLDTEISQSAIILNGITVSGDSIPRLINIFKGVGTAPNTLASIAPVGSSEFTSVTFQDFNKLHQQLNIYKGKAQTETPSEVSLLESGNEAGVIRLAEGSVFVIRSPDPDAARLLFDFELRQIEEFREKPIYEYPRPGAFQELLQPLLNPKELQFFTFLDSYILFAENSAALKDVITALQNDLVLSNSEAYKASSENLSSEASILMVRNNQAGSESIPEGLNFKNFPISAVQYIYQDDFAHVHSVLLKSAALKTEAATDQQAVIDLGAPLSGPPVYFKNHRTKGMDIAVQDVQNTLYLISPEGKIYWKKQLESRILGEVQTVDILRNGRYQLAFATKNELHVIDRDGNPVKPFPLKFRDDITQPLALFDYDNNRDYRFVIVQDNELLMYDRKGTSVKGFDFSKAGSEIVKTPKHIRIGRKDYILVPERSGKLHILSRTGKTRVPVSETFEFSDSEWYEYNGQFVSSNASGEIIKLSEQGTVKKEDINLSNNHHITATDKTLVTLSENELKIKGNPITLDFGLYSEPQLFYINNKIYVSVTDLQARKVFLFDSNGSLLNGFPIYGNSLIDLSNADDDPALELVVQGEDNGLVVYEVQ